MGSIEGFRHSWGSSRLFRPMDASRDPQRVPGVNETREVDQSRHISKSGLSYDRIVVPGARPNGCQEHLHSRIVLLWTPDDQQGPRNRRC